MNDNLRVYTSPSKHKNYHLDILWASLNDDHERIDHGLKLLKKMIDKKERREKILEILYSLEKEAELHFSHEEELMDAYDYSDFEKHRNNHFMIAQLLQTLVVKMEHNEYFMITNENIDSMINLLITHMGQDDTYLERYLFEMNVDRLTVEDIISRVSLPHKYLIKTF